MRGLARQIGVTVVVDRAWWHVVSSELIFELRDERPPDTLLVPLLELLLVGLRRFHSQEL